MALPLPQEMGMVKAVMVLCLMLNLGFSLCIFRLTRRLEMTGSADRRSALILLCILTFNSLLILLAFVYVYHRPL